MAADHPFDPRRARPALEPGDSPLLRDENEGRNLGDVETLRQIGVLVHVDARDAETVPFLAREVGEQALHPTPRPRPGRSEEEEEWSCRPVHHQGDSLPHRPANDRAAAARLRAMEGVLDWYLLGV